MMLIPLTPSTEFFFRNYVKKIVLQCIYAYTHIIVTIVILGNINIIDT